MKQVLKYLAGFLAESFVPTHVTKCVAYCAKLAKIFLNGFISKYTKKRVFIC